MVLHGSRRLASADDRRIMGRVARSGERRNRSNLLIITEPNSFVAEVRDRMPVLLSEQDHEPWLSGCVGPEFLRRTGEDLLRRWPVSKRVNSSLALN